MKIVIINHYAGSPTLGMEYRPYYFAHEWIRMGHQAMVVAATYSHVRSKQPEIAENAKRVLHEGVPYVWIKTNKYKGNGLTRLLSMFVFSWRIYKRLKPVFRDFKPDLIIASSTYPLENFAIFRLSKMFKAKYCYEVHDLWPLSPMELGGFSKYHPFILIMQKAEDYGYKNADFVVSLLPMAKPYMVSRGMSPDKFFYIPNGIRVEEWNYSGNLPKNYIEQLSHIRQKHTFLIAYTGSHGLANSLESFVLAGKQLPSEIGLVLVGDGPEKGRLQKLQTDEQIENVYFLDAIKKQFIPPLLAEFDALFIGLQKQSLFRFGISPNKMIDYMMAGKPIIQAIDAGNNMVKDYSCGIAVEPENPKSIAEGIKYILQLSGHERKLMGLNGQNSVKTFYDYKVLSQRFIDAANSINSKTYVEDPTI